MSLRTFSIVSEGVSILAKTIIAVIANTKSFGITKQVGKTIVIKESRRRVARHSGNALILRLVAGPSKRYGGRCQRAITNSEGRRLLWRNVIWQTTHSA
ncbi:hypothetical protein M0804_000304 [Polistes exclamans]|nr:hypothetical protein M0804_000304 [Polistes exclamans]